MTDDKQKPKIENGNSKLVGAQTAPRASNSDFQLSLNPPHLTPQQLQFLLRITPSALDGQRDYGVPACVTIAQAILESATAAGWGSNTLFRLANNPFGIKYSHFFSLAESAVDSSKSKVESKQPSTFNSQLSTSPESYGAFDAQTWEIENGQKKIVIAQFQRFPNLNAAFTEHARLLCSARYRPAFEVRHDWKQFAERLGPKISPLDMEHCGYSTNPSYSAELINLVSRYRLNDSRALQWFATGKDPGYWAVEPEDNRDIESSAHRTMGLSEKPGTDKALKATS